jgi:uncharacterized protein (TIGR01777 family)
MKVVLAGASGLIGTELTRSLLADGHEVRTLVRRPAARVAGTERPGGAGRSIEVEWHPELGQFDPAVLRGCDTVICLSGAGVGEHRWTPAYKQELRASRLVPVSALADALRSLRERGSAADDGHQSTFVVASAVGYYGDTGDRWVDERSPAGRGFLAELCRDWEAAARPAADAGARVVNLRTGLVLAPAGGLLGRLMPIMRLGIGGRLGSGRQYMPWISLADEVSAVRFILEHAELTGPLNLTGPAPVTNAEFTGTLARMIHRPAKLPVPALALRAVLGEFAEDALTGQRAVPAALSQAGFVFRHPTVESALRAALAGSRV